MTPIISFPLKPYIKITSGEVSETRHVSAHGTNASRNLKPVRSYFLEFIDDQGGACVWDGETYAEALLAANEWAIEGIPVRDHTDSWGRE